MLINYGFEVNNFIQYNHLLHYNFRNDVFIPLNHHTSDSLHMIWTTNGHTFWGKDGHIFCTTNRG